MQLTQGPQCKDKNDCCVRYTLLALRPLRRRLKMQDLEKDDANRRGWKMQDRIVFQLEV